jgi:orotidine-5'-phosphate decarboxylase
MSAGILANPLIVALDVDSPAECARLARLLAGRAGAFKLGPRLLVRAGEALVREVAASAPVFVDNKYLDIPSTMEAAVRATFDAGATLATAHAWAGREALERLARLERDLNKQRPFKILAVTVLTSFAQAGLPPPLDREPIDAQVEALGDLVRASGLSGLVCSPLEAARVKARFPGAYLVTPGVRLPGAEGGDDQKRTLGPAAALAQGADALVVGRPIVGAPDPVEAADRVLANIREGAQTERPR